MEPSSLALPLVLPASVVVLGLPLSNDAFCCCCCLPFLFLRPIEQVFLAHPVRCSVKVLFQLGMDFGVFAGLTNGKRMIGRKLAAEMCGLLERRNRRCSRVAGIAQLGEDMNSVAVEF